VRPQAHRLRVLRLELAHQAGPQQAGRAELGDLHEEVHADGPEEAQPRGELVDLEAHGLAGADVLHAVGQGVGHLDVGGRPSLLHVVAGDRDRVELRHVGRGEREDVGDDPHRRRRRVDVGVANHELLEDVVLDRARELLQLHPLLLGRDDVERQDRQHRAVHGHRHRHLVQRDAVEQLPHVQDRVDGHARHADVTGHPRVVGVVASVGGEVERDRQALLAGGEVAPVERVGLLCGGEAGVLPDRPRLVDVHGGVGPAQERRDAGVRLEEVQALVGGVVEQRRHQDVLGGQPALGERRGGVLDGRGTELDASEIGDGAHWATPIRSRVPSRKATTSIPSNTSPSMTDVSSAPVSVLRPAR